MTFSRMRSSSSFRGPPEEDLCVLSERERRGPLRKTRELQVVLVLVLPCLWRAVLVLPALPRSVAILARTFVPDFVAFTCVYFHTYFYMF